MDEVGPSGRIRLRMPPHPRERAAGSKFPIRSLLTCIQLCFAGAKVQILTLARLLPGAGLGAFCTRKPRPVEYQRDVRAPGQGWLTQGECEEAWDARMPWSQYAIGIELTGDWYRDEYFFQLLPFPS